MTIREDAKKMELRWKNAIDKARIDIDEEEWDTQFRIAMFLAVKDAMMRDRGSSLIDDDGDDDQDTE